MAQVDQVLAREVFCFNPKDNGGESLTLATDYIASGDPGVVHTDQSLTLASYCNSATFNLGGAAMTPENLRALADILEAARDKACKAATH